MPNIVCEKAKEFSLNIIKVYKFLNDNKREFVISKQLLRSGTSIGANIMEGIHAESKKDFLHKMNIALKEAAETEYWISLLEESGLLDEFNGKDLFNKCKELNKILRSIVKTTKANGLK